MEYKDKIVCFIDILRFRKLVEGNIDNPEKIYSTLSKISREVTDWQGEEISSKVDLKITQFSDSVVFSFVPSKHYFMTFHFFKELAIKMILEGEGVLLRGGITYGKVFHNSDFVFGPAMIKAYDLEHKEAVFPRIIIDQPAFELKNSDGKTIKDYTEQFVFKIDTLGYSFIDYIFDVNISHFNQTEYYRKLRAIIAEGLESKCPRVLEKYEWMKREYNEAKATFAELQEL